MVRQPLWFKWYRSGSRPLGKQEPGSLALLGHFLQQNVGELVQKVLYIFSTCHYTKLLSNCLNIVKIKFKSTYAMFETLRIGTGYADRGLILSSGMGRWRSRGSPKTRVLPGSMPSRGHFEGIVDYSECSSCSSPLLWLSRLKSGFSSEASLCSKGL